MDTRKALTSFQWIWVRGSEPSTKDSGIDEATKEAKKLCMPSVLGMEFHNLIYAVKEVTEKVENIKVSIQISQSFGMGVSPYFVLNRTTNLSH